MVESELTEVEKRQLIRIVRRARGNLVHYRKHLLTNEEADELPSAPFHKPLSDILLLEQDNFAIEAFRESAKTTYAIRTYCIHALQFPRPESDYIVIIKKNTSQARKRLKQIEREYLTNRIVSGNLHSIVEQSGDAFEIKAWDENGELHSVRIEAYGKGASIRGLADRERRPKIVILDDVQDKEDAQSETVQETDWDWFLSDVKFLGKRSRIFLIGNNLGEKSIIERVISQDIDLRFRKMKIPIVNDDGSSAWPEYMDKEEIAEEKESYRKLGKLDIWFLERMCEAISDETREFRREDFRYYGSIQKAPELSRQGNVYVRTDLAISEKKKADYSVIEAFVVTPENHWFILDVLYGHWDPYTMLDLLFQVVTRWTQSSGRQICNVGFPQVAYEKAFTAMVEHEKKRRNVFFNTMAQKQELQKELRIKALQPRFRAHTIFFPDEAPWLAELESELLMFPKGLRDDIIDTMANNDQEIQVPIGQVAEANLPRYGISDAALI